MVIDANTSLSIGLVIVFLIQLAAMVKFIVTINSKTNFQEKEIKEIKERQKEEIDEIKSNQKEMISKMENIAINLNETSTALAVCSSANCKT
jgi:Na+-transporting methylmalonyl-CoA/oxaloacetate decarboxylase gamma subunit